MAKAIKYYIGISTYNAPFTTLVITRNQYNEMLKKYEAIIKENHAINTPEDSEYYVEQNTRTYDRDKYTEEMINFDDGPACITLGKMICKPGFVFNK